MKEEITRDFTLSIRDDCAWYCLDGGDYYDPVMVCRYMLTQLFELPDRTRTIKVGVSNERPKDSRYHVLTYHPSQREYVVSEITLPNVELTFTTSHFLRTQFDHSRFLYAWCYE